MAQRHGGRRLSRVSRQLICDILYDESRSFSVAPSSVSLSQSLPSARLIESVSVLLRHPRVESCGFQASYIWVGFSREMRSRTGLSAVDVGCLAGRQSTTSQVAHCCCLLADWGGRNSWLRLARGGLEAAGFANGDIVELQVPILRCTFASDFCCSSNSRRRWTELCSKGQQDHVFRRRGSSG